jgi:hypothetical protein
MKEWVCNMLSRTDGEPKEENKPVIRAMAICLANCEDDCPKTRAKFRITPLCFRIRNVAKKIGDVSG